MKGVQWSLGRCVYILQEKRVRFLKGLGVRGGNISYNQDFSKMCHQEWSVPKQVTTTHAALLLGNLFNLWVLQQSHPFCLVSSASFKSVGWELQGRAMAREQERRAASFGQVGMQNKPTAPHVSHRHGLPTLPSIISSFNHQT